MCDHDRASWRRLVVFQREDGSKVAIPRERIWSVVDLGGGTVELSCEAAGGRGYVGVVLGTFEQVVAQINEVEE